MRWPSTAPSCHNKGIALFPSTLAPCAQNPNCALGHSWAGLLIPGCVNCPECEWAMKKSLLQERRVAGMRTVCVWVSKVLFMLSQEKQPANNNYWATSECRTWNPVSWNDHKSQGRLSPALEKQSLAGPPEQWHMCDAC